MNHPCTSLEDMWLVIRRVMGDDIAQQAVFRSVKKQGLNGDLTYLWIVAKNLRARRYSDGADVKKQDGTRFVGSQLKEGWDVDSEVNNPERRMLAIEELNKIDPQLLSWELDGTPLNGRTIKRLRGDLYPKEKKIIDCYQNGHSTREVARLLNIPQSTVFGTIARHGIGRKSFT